MFRRELVDMLLPYVYDKKAVLKINKYFGVLYTIISYEL